MGLKEVINALKLVYRYRNTKKRHFRELLKAYGEMEGFDLEETLNGILIQDALYGDVRAAQIIFRKLGLFKCPHCGK